MFETLPGIAHCERVMASRHIVMPKVAKRSHGDSLMVINKTGEEAQQTLSALVQEGILQDGSFTEIGDNIYLVETSDKYGPPNALCLTINDYRSRVYFVEPSEVHENHYGRCIPDGFACGVRDTDVWQKVLDGHTPDNTFVLTRSYHMDCEPDWTTNDTDEALSSEQQIMLELGLPLSFGQTKSFSQVCDDAVIAVEPDSHIVEKDYDKELADMSSSTERMSLSRSSRPESGDLVHREDLSSSSPIAASAETSSDSAERNPGSGSLTVEAFEDYWSSNGARILEETWREQYGEYMVKSADADSGELLLHDSCTKTDATDCSDEGISSERDDQDSKYDDEADEYANAWAKLWQQHCWDIYYKCMNELVAQEELTGYQASIAQTADEQNVSLLLEESMREPDDIEDTAPEGDESAKELGGQTSNGKRPLSIGDFGVSSTEGSCSVDNKFVKNHRLKKLKRESLNHKKDPNATSADALDDAPKDARLAKYWSQRYRLFRKFDDGIQMDDEAWFSVTPEKIAEHIAARMCPRASRTHLFSMDVFCGVGSNTIQLAKRSQVVLGVDMDASKIAMAKNNARVYGVDRHIDFVQADMAHFVPRIPPDAVFMSPPWGGPNYKNRESFDLDDLCVDFRSIFRAYEAISPNIAVMLPRNTKLDQLCQLARVEVEQNLLNKKVKTITAYFGGLICK